VRGGVPSGLDPTSRLRLAEARPFGPRPYVSPAACRSSFYRIYIGILTSDSDSSYRKTYILSTFILKSYFPSSDSKYRVGSDIGYFRTRYRNSDIGFGFIPRIEKPICPENGLYSTGPPTLIAISVITYVPSL
jgi:hypothetical protein